jgi:lauroyl/myristoyl acyltransferase
MSSADPAWPIPWQPVLGDRRGAWAWVEAQLVRGSLGALSRLPLGLQDALVGGVARAARRLDARHSDAARGFLRQAFGAGLTERECERRVLDAWRFFLTMVVRSSGIDRLAREGAFETHFEPRFAEGLREKLARHRGRIFVTPHLGDIEAGAFSLPRLGFSPVYAVSRPPRNSYLAAAVQRTRDARGYRLLHRHGAMDEVAKILQANGSLVLMLDQRARKRTVVAPFFGRPAHCERAPAILMRRLSVPLVTAWCEALPEPWRYRLHFTRIFEPQDFARATPEEIATALNHEMELMILSAPEQYFWLHDRYRKAPLPS